MTDDGLGGNELHRRRPTDGNKSIDTIVVRRYIVNVGLHHIISFGYVVVIPPRLWELLMTIMVSGGSDYDDSPPPDDDRKPRELRTSVGSRVHRFRANIRKRIDHYIVKPKPRNDFCCCIPFAVCYHLVSSLVGFCRLHRYCRS